MRQRGFTLIELLVVMVLLGLLAGIAVTTMGGSNQGRELINEVNRLHAVLRMASQEAIFNNEEIGVIIDSDIYEFLVYQEDEKQWVNASQPFLQPYTLPEWISIDFQREGRERKILGDSSTSEFSGSDVGQSSSKKPQMMLLSSGEVTGFTIGMQIENDSDSRLEITLNDQGEIILPHIEEQNES